MEHNEILNTDIDEVTIEKLEQLGLHFPENYDNLPEWLRLQITQIIDEILVGNLPQDVLDECIEDYESLVETAKIYR